MHDDIKLLFKDAATLQLFEPDIQKTVDGREHGRIETRTYRVIEMPEVLKENHDWCGLKTLIEVVTERDIKGVTTEEKRYISSLAKNATQLSKAIRYHW